MSVAVVNAIALRSLKKQYGELLVRTCFRLWKWTPLLPASLFEGGCAMCEVRVLFVYVSCIRFV